MNMKILLREMIFFMDNTENLKNVIGSIDDETLRRKIESIAAALGLSADVAQSRFTDTAFIRDAVMNMSAQDLDNILTVVGKDRANDILRDINKK